MPKAKVNADQLSRLEARQRALHQRILAERRVLFSKDARRRAAERSAHERALFRVLRRFELEGTTPTAFDALLGRAGLLRKARHAERGEELGEVTGTPSDAPITKREAPGAAPPESVDHMSPHSENDSTTSPATTK